MGAVDFVVGILVGILLACVSFVLQTSQVSAIRGSLPGSVASSTVRRHPIQTRFLQEAGRQIYVMKLAGYLFFGTIVGVETKIRELLADSLQIQSIRFLVLDLHNVDGIDFSAAEAFMRINRILKSKDVKIIICGISMSENVGRSLCNVGLFDAEDDEEEVQYFASLNSALEYCENFLLKSFYDQQRNALTEIPASSATVCKPSPTFENRVKILKTAQMSPQGSRRLPKISNSTPHVGMSSIAWLQWRLTSRIMCLYGDGKSTGSLYSLSCKHSQVFPTSRKISGSAWFRFWFAESISLGSPCTSAVIGLTVSTCSKLGC